PRLADVSLDDLERRVKEAGLEVIGRGEQRSPALQRFIHYEKDGVQGTAYVNRVPMAEGTPAESEELLTLPTIKSWIDFDRAQKLELVYGIQGPYVMSFTGKSKDVSLSQFAQVSQGITFSLQGSSFGSPDPASNANEAKSLWRAQALDELSL